jgi:YfiH family protein
MSPSFVQNAEDGIDLLQCRFLRGAGVPHGFTFKGAFGRRENVASDREKLSRALGFSRVGFMRQVHGNDVRAFEPDGSPPFECDGLVTDREGLGVVVQTADCVPLLLWDARANAVAAVHAGWRGTLLRVTTRALAALRSSFGSSASGVHAAIGPAIRACCFEVGNEVVAAFEASGREIDRISRPGKRERLHIDLIEDNRHQLLDAGVPEAQIHDSGLCTHCEPERLYSFRREGPSVGRLMGAIGIAVR